MAAASTGKSERVRLLLEKGADAKARTRRNETALADAATAGDEATVALLLEHGAEVNVQDVRGYSPLLYAAGSDAMPAGVVRMLLAKGADRTAKGDDETAQMLAAKRGHTEVARLLGVPEQDRYGPSKSLPPAARSVPSPKPSAPRLVRSRNRAITLSVSADVTRAMRRTCPLLRRASLVTAVCQLRSRSRNCRRV